MVLKKELTPSPPNSLTSENIPYLRPGKNSSSELWDIIKYSITLVSDLISEEPINGLNPKLERENC